MGALRLPQNRDRRDDAIWRLPQSGGGNEPPADWEDGMHSDHQDIRPHKNKHLAERFEGLLGTLMVVAIVLLAVGMIYGIMHTDSTPSWMH